MGDAGVFQHRRKLERSSGPGGGERRVGGLIRSFRMAHDEYCLLSGGAGATEHDGESQN
jgi:hypothetical protein